MQRFLTVQKISNGEVWVSFVGTLRRLRWFVFLVVVLTLWSTRHRVSSSEGVLFVLNRWTGQVSAYDVDRDAWYRSCMYSDAAESLKRADAE